MKWSSPKPRWEFCCAPNSLSKAHNEKTKVAKDLKHDRIHRESGFSTPADSVSGSVRGSEDDVDLDDLELKSIHSLDTRTFITEPKMGARLKVGRDALNEKSENFQWLFIIMIDTLYGEIRHTKWGSHKIDNRDWKPESTQGISTRQLHPTEHCCMELMLYWLVLELING